jgi:carotenoid cleavage dioxygenase
MTSRYSRRNFLRGSGVGLAGATALPLLSACSRRYDTPENPEFWKSGNYPPVSSEVTETQLQVEGKLPPELSGLYVRNGPNAADGQTDHFFMGDGMLHGVRLENGRASWYRNRFVQTPLLGEDSSFPLKPPSLEANQSNVSLIHHGGKLLSLGEAGWAYEIDPEDLSTIGLANYGGELQTAMTAHPKIDPDSGDMHFFGYGVMQPYLTYHRADAAGRLVRSVEIETAGPAMMHDFAMTENHLIFMELPVVFSWFKVFTLDAFPFAWDSGAACRMGVLPKNGQATDIRWFDVPTCFIFHTMNAFEEGDRVIVDAARYDSLWVKGSSDFNHPAHLTRFSFNLASGAVSVDQVHDQSMEFPQVNRRQWGRPYRYGYSLSSGTEDGHMDYNGATGVLKFDMQTGAMQRYALPRGVAPGEAFFVPAADADTEDAGYLLSYVYSPESRRSALWIFDAMDIEAGPLAQVHLPVRVPMGFHGVWVPEALI